MLLVLNHYSFYVLKNLIVMYNIYNNNENNMSRGKGTIFDWIKGFVFFDMVYE